MATSSEPVCREKPTRCLRIPLRSNEQIYLIFLIPIAIGCAVYVVNFAADLVVAIQHIRAGNLFWGLSTVALMYAPAIAYFALTVSRPDWWMTEDENRPSGGAAGWFAVQIAQLIFFPLFALYRYASLIVLAIDALLLEGPERAKTVKAAAAPAAIELYFFLQAWFQAAPQAVFQTHLLFREYPGERTHQTVVVHMLCILMSIVVLAIQTASYQRFESQRINGRKLPWAMWLQKHRETAIGKAEEKRPLQTSSRTPEVERSSGATPLTEECRNPGEETQTQAQRVNFERQISLTPPLPPKNVRAIPPPAPIRGLTSVQSLPVPEMQAPPRPDSIFNEEVTTPPAPLENDGAAPRPSASASVAMKWRHFRIPKRTYSMKGLDEDDPIGKFVAFVWWFFFILARVFAVAIAYEFYPVWVVGLLALHYVLMIAFLFYYAKYYDVTNFFLTLWLGLVFVFSVIEYRVKFKHADFWLVAYYAFVIVQNCLLTVAWFVYAEWSGFWYTYMFFAIFTSMALCIMSAGVYNLLLKPKKRRIYAS